MSIQSRSVTRGHGALEGLLAQLRSRQADRLIPPTARSGRLLDVGFGTYPLFLTRTRFAERYGLDRAVPDGFENSGLHLIAHDVAEKRTLPFESAFFDTVTMLAVFEHLETGVLLDLITEMHRVLKRSGVLVLTTPADWTSGMLKFMSRIRLVSEDEIDEHHDQYTPARIVDLLSKGGFDRTLIEVGKFELGMNLWARARRE